MCLPGRGLRPPKLGEGTLVIAATMAATAMKPYGAYEIQDR
jgi:hypothetical protein